MVLCITTAALMAAMAAPATRGAAEGRRLVLSAFPPLIPASCPQFPALNGPGVLCEDFDTERNGAPGFQFTRLPVGVDPNDPLRALGDPGDDVLGYTQTTGPTPSGTGGRVCSDLRGVGHLGCDAPVAEENDWHLHSPYEGPGDGYDPPERLGIGAPDGGKAHSGFRSMHWGRHTQTSGWNRWPYLYDTVRFRQVAAFVLDLPINPGPASRLEFWHLISVPDDENVGNGFLTPGTTFGGGQVQISLIGSDGRFARWVRLSPDLNGYDSTVQNQVAVCQFDPGDDDLPPAGDTMCMYSPMWADLGDVVGTDVTCQIDTDGNDPWHKDCGTITSCTGGPGCTENGSLGSGVWARSAFDLSPFAGRQARLRWIGSMMGGWSFGVSRSFAEPEPGGFYPYYELDAGWFIDDIVLSDLREAPLSCGLDGDLDGFGMCDDCDDADPAVWAQPGSTGDLAVSSDGVTFSWGPPSEPGGDAVTYDLLRTAVRFNFFEYATCLASVQAGLSAADPQTPQPGSAFYYLARARNGCPYGRAPLGAASTGVPRDGRACP